MSNDPSDAFDEIATNTLSDASFAKRIADLSEIADQTIIGIPFTPDQAKHMLEVLRHAADHGCPESFAEMWRWMHHDLGPALLSGLNQYGRLLHGTDD